MMSVVDFFDVYFFPYATLLVSYDMTRSATTSRRISWREDPRNGGNINILHVNAPLSASGRKSHQY